MGARFVGGKFALFIATMNKAEKFEMATVRCETHLIHREPLYVRFSRSICPGLLA